MKKTLIAAAVILTWAICPVWNDTSFAHSPHDLIVDIVASPESEKDGTVFMIVSNTLMVSKDKGYSWRKLIHGLDHLYQLKSVAVSPHYGQDRTVLVSSDGDGIYRSRNGGGFWEKVNTGLASLHIHTVRMSGEYSSTHPLAAAIDREGRLWLSDIGGGADWHQQQGYDGKAACLAFVPFEQGERILLGTNDGRLYISDHNVGSWRQVWRNTDAGTVSSIAVSPFFGAEKTVWLGTERAGVYEVDLDQGDFLQINEGLSDKHITTICGNPSGDDTILFASTWDEGFFLFDTKSQKWVKKSVGLTTDSQAREPLFMSAHFKGIAFVEDKWLLGGFDGLFESTNGGESWRQLETISPKGITGLALSTDDQLCLATYGGGAYLLDSHRNQWSVINRGLQWTRLNDILFSPMYNEDGLIFSGSENNFLVFQKASGAWQRYPVPFGLKRQILLKIEHYLTKMGMGISVWGSIFRKPGGDTRFPTAIAIPSPFNGDQPVYFGTRSSGIYRHDQAGQRNEFLWDAGYGLVTALSASPDFEKDGTIFAGISGKGVFQTKDRGDSWEKVSGDLPFTGEVYLCVSPHYAVDKTIFAGSGSGLACSYDGGATWKQLDLGRVGGAPNITCLAISPNYEKDRLVLAGIQGLGIWASRDGGALFSPFASQLIENNHQAKFIEFSKNFVKDATLYCATSFELLRSVDGGKTWTILHRPLRYEDLREEIRFEGSWSKTTHEDFGALSETSSSVMGSQAYLSFIGSGIRWIGSRSSLHGGADIYIDGRLMAHVSQYANGKEEKRGTVVFETRGLERSRHEIVIEVKCSEARNGACGKVSIDALEVVPFTDEEVLSPDEGASPGEVSAS